MEKTRKKIITNLIRMDSAPYLVAIQSLDGVRPGDKFKTLNNMVNEISSKSKTKGAITGLEVVPTPLIPLVRVMIAKRLKINELIVEALKSNDSDIVNKALSADFFFNPLNKDVKPIIFTEKLMPYVSLCTRFKIIKKLSISLIKDEKNAEEFFKHFSKLYGVTQASPLLIACSEGFTYDYILKHKIILSVSMVEMLFRIKPNLVIRYLHLGNDDNDMNEKDREIHTISLYTYKEFLPALIKNHVEDFITLYEHMKSYYSYIKVENKKTILFIKSARNTLIEKPNIFLKLFNLKLVSKILTENEFQTMFKNLFPEQSSDCNIPSMINYLNFYQKGDKFSFFCNKFKEVYGEDIFDNIKHVAVPEFLLLMPDSLREKQAVRLVEHNKKEINSTNTAGNYPNYSTTYDWRCYLPLKESIPLFKDIIKKESDMFSRSFFISKMIYSCRVYENKTELINILKYYKERHKNEQQHVLNEFFKTITDYWVEKLENDHWEILKDIIQRAFIKDVLLSVPRQVVDSLLTGLVSNILQNLDDKDAQDWYKKALNMLVEFEITHNSGEFGILQKTEPRFQQKLLNDILNFIPQKYPAFRHDNEYGKLNVVTIFLNAIWSFNEKITKELSKDHKSTIPGKTVKPFELKDFPWLVNQTKQLFSNVDYQYQKTKLKNLLKLHEPDIFKQIVLDNPSEITIKDSKEILDKLIRNPEEVIKTWQFYLEEVKEKLVDIQDRAARRFIAKTKWYKDIPINFVNYAVKNIKEEGCILVLGILLEGQTFSKIITPLVPKESEIDVNNDESKQHHKIVSQIPFAITMTNPPCDLDIIEAFCQGDYLPITIKCLNNVAMHVPFPDIMAFAKRLILNRVSLKKHGIRIIVQISPRKELIEYLTELWNTEKHYSIRNIVALEILNIFRTDPCEETFNLIKKCISEITMCDKSALQSILSLNLIDTKYAGLYFAVIFKKVEDLSKNDENAPIGNYISQILNSLDEKIMNFIEESIFIKIFDRYFFVPSSTIISRRVQSFVVEQYLLPASEEKFESRLNIVSNILRKLIQEWRKPCPKKLRTYPANNTLLHFIDELLTTMLKRKFSKCEIVIRKLGNILSSLLLPWQYPVTYIKLTIYNEYFLSSSPNEFGLRCSQKLGKFVKDFSTEFILDEVVLCLSEIISQVSNDKNYRLEVIQSVIEGDKLYGSVVGIKLLCANEVSDYDSKYETIIQTLDGSKDNVMLQYFINRFLNNLD